MGRRVVPVSVKQGRDQALAKAAAAFIRDCLDHPPTMYEVAQTLATNVSTLQQAFKAEYGKTLAVYAREFRLEEAKRLLEATDWMIESISIGCGYGDRGSFTVAFKKAFGVSPGRWREKQVKDIHT